MPSVLCMKAFYPLIKTRRDSLKFKEPDYGVYNDKKNAY